MARAHWLFALAGSTLWGGAACSLLIDTDGLLAPPLAEAGAPAETGAPDADADAGAAETGADAGGDGSFSCDGGFVTTGWSTFEPTDPPAQGLTIAGDVVEVTASTNGVGQTISETIGTGSDVVPRRVHLAYDVTVSPMDNFYYEPGCSLSLSAGSGAVFRAVPYVNRTDYGDQLTADGPPEVNHSRSLGTLSSGPSTHRVDVEIMISGTMVVSTLTYDGAAVTYTEPVPSAPERAAVVCGIPYGEQTIAGNSTVAAKVSKLELAVCP